MSKSFQNWREPVVDPYNISFKHNIELKEIISYPHAGNDVFECIGEVDYQTKHFYIKVERHNDSNFENEASALTKLKKYAVCIPTLTEFQKTCDYTYIVTEHVDGERLSSILGQSTKHEFLTKSLSYMFKYGESLSNIHNLKIDWSKAPLRKFHSLLDSNSIRKYDLHEINDWLVEHEPPLKETCFIHGDYHYANILWNSDRISAVLDWELCGIGFKEFDIAWSVILRPSQQFLQSYEEREAFLNGYRVNGSFNEETLKWCEVLIYSRFYAIGHNIKNKAYVEFVIQRIKDYTGITINSKSAE